MEFDHILINILKVHGNFDIAKVDNDFCQDTFNEFAYELGDDVMLMDLIQPSFSGSNVGEAINKAGREFIYLWILEHHNDVVSVVADESVEVARERNDDFLREAYLMTKQAL